MTDNFGGGYFFCLFSKPIIIYTANEINITSKIIVGLMLYMVEFNKPYSRECSQVFLLLI